MSNSRTTPHTRALAWWLGEGEEVCPHCGQRYAYEVEIRCTQCDSPACPHCARSAADGSVACVACIEAGPAA